MDEQDIDTFLRAQHTCRLGTVSADGTPHVTPLWFVWDGWTMWFNSSVRTRRWSDIRHEARVSALVDAGESYRELHGVELMGTAEPVGDVPRTALHVAELVQPERLYADKYRPGRPFRPDGRHAWLRLAPDKIVSWDFRKGSAD
jgi:nitroimidazol reductase NimA-like FMN-containing flavoprotein (pyridoxamine 5'-phosphate oxidase superfamily)